ncbi:hypothetical protein C8R43DRAFT_957729 [Mycena crocata]|nr:hypothetical protein C8R43DRAFT_957729 [Mycena crocata]
MQLLKALGLAITMASLAAAAVPYGQSLKVTSYRLETAQCGQIADYCYDDYDCCGSLYCKHGSFGPNGFCYIRAATLTNLEAAQYHTGHGVLGKREVQNIELVEDSAKEI